MSIGTSPPTVHGIGRFPRDGDGWQLLGGAPSFGVTSSGSPATVSRDLRVSGSVTIYRLFDVGYAIALDRAADLLGAAIQGRVRPSRLEAKAIEIRNPPLFAALGSFEVAVGDATCRATVSAHLYDFGVCSLYVRVAAPPEMSWSGFVDFTAGVDGSPALPAVFSRELGQLIDRIRPAIERAATAPLSEEYKICRIDRIAGDGATRVVSELLTDDQLVALLLGERQGLSPSARRELVPHRFSYFQDDLTVLTWDAALVVEPRADDRDVEIVLEFANAQLLELRMFDQQLDAELPALYDRVEVARTRRRPRLAGRFRALLSDLQTRVADITEIVERVENSLKVVNDVYLARIYSATLELFREQAWRRGIERKLGILRETYTMLNAEAQSARAELLEVIIVLLIVAELFLALVHGR